MSVVTRARRRAVAVLAGASIVAATLATVTAPAAHADTPLPSTCTTTTYAGFGGDVSALRFNGTAAPTGSGASTVARLTRSFSGQAGSVFTTQPVNLTAGGSFSSRFQFRISDPDWDGADGLTFTVQTQSNNAGGAGGGMGYEGISPSVGIEFDTYANYDRGDVDDNHVGIDLNGDIVSAQQASLYPYGIYLDDYGTTTKTAWVDYDGATGLLEIRVSNDPTRPATPVLSRTLDLAALLGSTDAFLGFTAATGASWGTHDIVDWDYSNCYRPAGVDASPFVDAGGPYDGGAATAVPIVGSASDDRSTPTTLWTYSGPGTCVIADPTAVSTTVSCDTPGTYTLRLTGNDGVNAPVFDEADLTVTELPADIAVTKSADRASYDAGETVTYTLTASNLGTTPARDVIVSDPVPHDITVTGVDAPCTFVGQQVSCPVGTLPGGATRSFEVRGTVTGTAPSSTPGQGDHQLDVQKHDLSWSLAAGAQQTVGLTCPGGGIVTDVSSVTSAVDQGTGTPADVETRAIGPVSVSRGEATLVNHATGQAQGHFYLTCLGATTSYDDGHAHGVLADPDLAVTSVLPAGVQSVVQPLAADRVGVAPGFRVLSGSAALLGSEPVAQGRRLTYLVGPAGAVVESSVRPLHRQTDAAGASSHVHDLALQDVSDDVTVPTGRSTHNVTCPDSGKGITALFRVPAGVTLGDEPQPVTRSFTLDNATGGPASVRVGVTCLGIRTTGALAAGVVVTNTASIISATADSNPGNNTASANVVVRRAIDDDPGGPLLNLPRAGFTQGAAVTGRSKVLVGRLSANVSGTATVTVRSSKATLGRASVRLTAGKARTLRIRLKQKAGKASLVVVRIGSTTQRFRLR